MLNKYKVISVTIHLKSFENTNTTNFSLINSVTQCSTLHTLGYTIKYFFKYLFTFLTKMSYVLKDPLKCWFDQKYNTYHNN